MSDSWDLTDCGLSDFFFHGILQARIPEWIVIFFSRGSSPPRNWTQVSCIAGWLFTHWTMRELGKCNLGLPQWLSTQESACNAGSAGDAGSMPGSGRSPGGVHGSPLQKSCLENPVDRGAWRAIVHRVAKSWTQLKWLNMHTNAN